MRKRTRSLLWVIPILALAGVAAAPAPSLIDAVKTSDWPAVRMLLRHPDAVNTPDVEGTRPLHWVVQRRDVAMVDALLAAGADATVANRYHMTPLLLATTNGSAAIIERLVKA